MMAIESFYPCKIGDIVPVYDREYLKGDPCHAMIIKELTETEYIEMQKQQDPEFHIYINEYQEHRNRYWYLVSED